MRISSVVFLAGLMIASGSANTQEALIPLEVSLGDVSLNKVPFLVAADEGIYVKHGLAVHQYITPYAADKAFHQGLNVPPEYVKADSADDAHIAVGGGTPMIVRMTRDVRATDRVIIATFENRVRNHIVSSWEIDSPEDLRGKRLSAGFKGAPLLRKSVVVSVGRSFRSPSSHRLFLLPKPSGKESPGRQGHGEKTHSLDQEDPPQCHGHGYHASRERADTEGGYLDRLKSAEGSALMLTCHREAHQSTRYGNHPSLERSGDGKKEQELRH